ncbi:MAG TPA: ABC transporter substrate-binding protein [Beijerinckiaceae bacterium]|jgi:ABC-type nitrate/sulfonate/bicarbonate transport system substrate-binding protein|nr:ABC transporter substrate-binding protein [Beijerinckiaceae bacterium]
MKSVSKKYSVLLIAALSLISSASARAQDQLLPVTVELGDVSLTKVPFIVAADAGIYERNGLKVDQFITPAAAAAVREAGVSVPSQYIRSGIVGQINIGGGSPTLVRMTTVATAPHRIILATTDDVSRYHIISRPDITSIDQLKGRRFGYGNFGALGHYSLMLFFQKVGWDPVRDVSMFTGGGEPSAITKGYVDAMAATDVTLDQAKQEGIRDLIDLSQYHFPMPGSGVNALSDWLPKNRETAARFIKATVEAIAVVKTDKKTALASITKWFGITDPAKLDSVYADARLLPSKPYPSIEGLKAMQSVYKWREMEIRTPEDFSDSSFVADLDKSGFIDGLYKDKTTPQ